MKPDIHPNLDVCAKEPDKPLLHGPWCQVQNRGITNIIKKILELKNMETYFVHNVIDLVIYLFVKVEGLNV